MQKLNPNSAEDYISKCPDFAQTKLHEMRTIILKAIPHAQEVISYQMPAYRTSEILVYFAAFAKHMSLFPTNSGVEAFQDKLIDYTTSKGTIQFEYTKPLPKKLIADICKFRDAEAKVRAESKKSKKTCKNGHTFYKSSDCPTCPTCETLKFKSNAFLSKLSAPARRALESKGIDTLKKLTRHTEAEILAFHGIGKTTIPILIKYLQEANLSFKRD